MHPLVVLASCGLLESETQVLAEVMHVPPAAEILVSDWHRHHQQPNSRELELIVQFTPEQYDAYVATLHDPSVWAFEPFTIGTDDFEGSVTPDAMRWYEGHEAWGPVSLKERISWLHWGRRQKERGAPVFPEYSFCLALDSGWFSSEVMQCKERGRSGPDGFLRAMLVPETKQLWIHGR